MITLPQHVFADRPTVFWFRRDLRLQDNAGLYRALKAGHPVVPIFIFDTHILNKLEDKADRRVEFIHQSITHLNRQLHALGSSLVVFYGTPRQVFEHIRPALLFANSDYEPYARQRDSDIQKLVHQQGGALHLFKDQVIFEKAEVVKDDGKPYTVFTPYSRKWKAALQPFFVKPYPTEKYFHQFKKIPAQPVPTLASMGFQETSAIFPDRVIPQSIIAQYDKTRNFPAIKGTTRLSVHLRFGTVSIRQLAAIARQKNEAWLNELIWRDFYHMILWHFPHVATRAFKPAYDKIPWRTSATDFERWCEGQTGYPMVDAGMRELNATGFMHNRVRMIVASFLTKHLLIDWRWGEAYFAKKLLDFDLAANNGGWQWAASSGCDAAPYFRVFNPLLQTEKFDPHLDYVKKWVPELGTPAYPKPLVEHKFARDRVLKTYKEALGETDVAA